MVSFNKGGIVKYHYKTIGDILNACEKCKTKEDAEKVLKKAKEDNPKYAEANIGYILGYLNKEERNRLYKLFSKCNHPIFGSGFGRENYVTPEVAYCSRHTYAKKKDKC